MRKFLIVILSILVIAGIAIGVIVYKTNQTEPSICLKEYFEKLNNKEYDAMYDYVKTNTSKEDLVSKLHVFNEFTQAVERMIAGEYVDTEYEGKEIHTCRKY